MRAAARLILAVVLAAALGAAAGPPPAAVAHPQDGVKDADHDNVDDPPFPNGIDNCAGENGAYNPDQLDTDADGFGDACDVDDDADGLDDAVDNCPRNANQSQRDTEGDGQGDPCDQDDDNDDVTDLRDNCRFVANPGQADADDDRVGDACDPDAPRAQPAAPATPDPPPAAAVQPPAGPDAPADDGQEPRARISGLERTVRTGALGAGLAVPVTCSERCSMTALLRAGRRRVGTGTADLAAAGRTYVFVDLDRRVRRLARGKRMRTTLELSVVDAAGNRVRVRRTLTIVGGS